MCRNVKGVMFEPNCSVAVSYCTEGLGEFSQQCVSLGNIWLVTLTLSLDVPVELMISGGRGCNWARSDLRSLTLLFFGRVRSSTGDGHAQT
jgi:hypothetical protein